MNRATASRKVVITYVILFTVILMFAACSANPSSGALENNPETAVQKYTREYWGEWKKMDQSETWEITSTSIKVNGDTLTKDVVLAKPSENVISVTDGKITYCLYAIRTASSQITGSVESDDGTKGVGGWLPVMVQNINDRYDKVFTTTDAEGRFKADDLIAGEQYNIRIGETSLNFMPSFDGEDIGNITLREGVNFKVTLSNSNSLMFAGSQYYSMDLIIENIGDTNCTAATYSLNADDGLEVINNYSEGVLLRTVAAGEKKAIPLQVRCSVPETETTIRKLNLTITDVTGATWNDSVSLKFYKGTLTINVISENDRPISGVIIGDGRTYTITNRSTYSVEIPMTEEGYLLVFSGAIANAARNTECAYSIGIDQPAIAASGLLSTLGPNTNSYEPNDDETHAQGIADGDTIVSYLYENDIDYYRLVSAHVWNAGEVLKEATCTEDGLIVFTCTDCGQTKEQVIKSVGHIVEGESITKEATCTEDGKRTGHCSVCGETIETIIPATGHSFSSEWITDDEYHWHNATCGHDVVDGKAVHTWDNGVVTKTATCTESGTKTYTCTVCGRTKTGSYTVSHNWNAGTIIKQATTTETGSIRYSCLSCGATKTDTIPMIVYSIGDRGPAGGWVFYDCDADNKNGNADGLISSKCGWRYLEVAPEDIKVGSTVHFCWGDDGVFNTKTEIGTGKANTAIIVSKASNTHYPNAATLCNDYVYNGYDDWFLPSVDELTTIGMNLRVASNPHGFVTDYYLSSSEFYYPDPDLDHLTCYEVAAFFMSFPYVSYSGGLATRDSSTCRVRAIRAF